MRLSSADEAAQLLPLLLELAPLSACAFEAADLVDAPFDSQTLRFCAPNDLGYVPSFLYAQSPSLECKDCFF
jgi:hypothetical protein